MDEVKTNPDGTVDIPLRKALKIAGADVKVLRMREPTVADQLAAQKSGAEPGPEQELALFAALCMMAPADLHGMGMRDYKRVQAAYLGFID